MDYLSDRPSDSVMFKSLSKLSYATVQHSIDQYFQTVLQVVEENEYDFVFFLGGMSICFNPSQFEELKRATTAKFVLYLWDSLRNCQRVGASLGLFDVVCSFEPDDCQSFGLYFLPLFYTEDYGALSEEIGSNFEYDACFVGSVHQIEKFKMVNSIVERLRSEGARVITHYFLPSKSVGMLRKFQCSAYRKADLKYTSLSRNQVVRIIQKSKIVIDAPQKSQSGLTMRSIEAVGANRRLITSNSSVRNYDFFSSGNIEVFSNTNPVNDSFCICNPVPYSPGVRERYSIKSWVDFILRLVF